MTIDKSIVTCYKTTQRTRISRIAAIGSVALVITGSCATLLHNTQWMSCLFCDAVYTIVFCIPMPLYLVFRDHSVATNSDHVQRQTCVICRACGFGIGKAAKNCIDCAEAASCHCSVRCGCSGKWQIGENSMGRSCASCTVCCWVKSTQGQRTSRWLGGAYLEGNQTVDRTRRFCALWFYHKAPGK